MYRISSDRASQVLRYLVWGTEDGAVVPQDGVAVR